MHHADLDRADLQGCDFRGANFSDGSLVSANLHNARLSNADLSYADLRNTNLSNVEMENAELWRCNFRGYVITPKRLHEILSCRDPEVWILFSCDRVIRVIEPFRPVTSENRCWPHPAR